MTSEELEFLRKALALAEGGRGRVSPNPLVGAVVVRDGEVIGEGFHAELGGLHAERAALADAARRGEDVTGATIYVTLEPCAHHGRQPPCSDAIIEADLGRVVIASTDPTAKASGKGPEQLRAAGIQVDFVVPASETAAARGADPEGNETGPAAELARAARLLNQPFRKFGASGQPYVVLKTAISLDGRTITPEGASPWISGEESRRLVHVWRGECDAIAVGIGTVLADDPLLTARMGGEARQPARVVFDSDARLPLDSQLLATIDQAPVIVVTGPGPDPTRADALRAAGAELIATGGADLGDRVPAAMVGLGRRGLTSLLLEGGATLAAAFAAAEQIDEARVFVAPLILGGTMPAVPDTALQGGSTEAEAVGEDTLIRTRFKEW
jgi:diaminohydroxyphosphoribosylaminopyrimidine deaminase/5-amino-6-(5-phosphoribosylamino)uracil reductase